MNRSNLKPVPETQDLDKVLNEMDPELVKSLDTIKTIEIASDLNIESAQLEDVDDNETEEKKKKTIRLWIKQKRTEFKTWRARQRTRFFLFIKTVPKEVAIATLIALRNIAKTMLEYTVWAIRSFFGLSQLQKFTLILLTGMGVTLASIVIANLKGKWIPPLNDPMLTSFEPRADQVFEFDPKEKMISFSRAFPQDPEIFLFDKIKVNLKRGQGHVNPMGAFEFYAQVDSHETAIELQARQVELHDVIQRVLEGIFYDELISDLGKNRLKGLLKTSINRELTQGWVVEIHFKSFVLKP